MLNNDQSNFTSKEEWCEQEIILLKNIYPNFNSKKWKNIAVAFKQNGFTRSETQIRQKWINFVDPNINNSNWTYNELEIIYKCYHEYGSRWSLTQKQLKNRTQNKIKNRFYGTLRNLIRVIVKTFGKDGLFYTAEISHLSPTTLNNIYDGQEQFNFMKTELHQIIKEMNYQFDRNMFAERLCIKQKKYLKLYHELVRVFKEQKKYFRKNKQQRQIQLKFEENSEYSEDINRLQILVRLQNLSKPQQNQNYIKIEQQNIQLRVESANKEQLLSSNTEILNYECGSLNYNQFPVVFWFWPALFQNQINGNYF